MAQLYAPYGGLRYSSGTMPTAKGFTGQRADAPTGLDYYGVCCTPPRYRLVWSMLDGLKDVLGALFESIIAEWDNYRRWFTLRGGITDLLLRRRDKPNQARPIH
ncbi:MAG TPA: hypothetical protein VF808_01930 [Ktedonobacterales bacterium]